MSFDYIVVNKLKYQLVLYSVVKVRSSLLGKASGVAASRTGAPKRRTIPADFFTWLFVSARHRKTGLTSRPAQSGLCQKVSCVCSSAASFKLQFLTLPHTVNVFK